MQNYVVIILEKRKFREKFIIKTGTTAKAVHAIGGGNILSFAMSDKLLSEENQLKCHMHL